MKLYTSIFQEGFEPDENPNNYNASREIAKLLGFSAEEAESLVDTLTLESPSQLYQDEVEIGIKDFVSKRVSREDVKEKLSDPKIISEIYEILKRNHLALDQYSTFHPKKRRER